MADINDYVDNLNYQFNEREKSLMDIFAECWEYCRRHECKDCKYSNGNKHIKMMICMSYQYAQKLIAADVQEVRHGKNITKLNPTDEFICSECGYMTEDCTQSKYNEDGDYYYLCEYEYKFCPNCGAKMDKG